MPPGEGIATRPSNRAEWARFARPGLLVLVAGVSLYMVLPSLLAVFSSWSSLDHLTWYWAALALLSEAGSFVCIWQLDRIALHAKSWFVVACAQLSGFGIGKILPGGGATGTAVSVGMLRRAGVEPGQATAALAASSALQFGTVLALPVIALPAILSGAPVDHSLALSAYLGAVVLALLAGAGILAFAFDEPLSLAGRAAQWVANKTFFRHRPLTDLPQRLLKERDFVRATIGSRWQAAVLTAVGVTALDYLALLFALRAVGAEPRPSLIFLAYVSTQLLTLVPFTPGGLGFVEAGLVGALTLAGVASRGRAPRHADLSPRVVLAADPGRRCGLRGIPPPLRLGGAGFPKRPKADLGGRRYQPSRGRIASRRRRPVRARRREPRTRGRRLPA